MDVLHVPLCSPPPLTGTLEVSYVKFTFPNTIYAVETQTNYDELTLWVTNCTVLVPAPYKTTVVPTVLQFYKKGKNRPFPRITERKKKLPIHNVFRLRTPNFEYHSDDTTYKHRKHCQFPKTRERNRKQRRQNTFYFFLYSLLFILRPTYRRRTRTADDSV